MTIKLMDLPYSKDALAPVISTETIDYHYGKHHQAYVNNLNKLIEGTPMAGKTLEAIIKETAGKNPGVFNNAAQVWNHNLYWNSLSPSGGGEPSGKVADAINKSFGGYSDFKAKFSDAAAKRFGSGWAWLVKQGDKLDIVTTSNADTPIAEGKETILTLDVWEHAYYVDYRNARPKYIEEFWKLINWDQIAKHL